MIKHQKNKDCLFWKLHQGIHLFHTLRHLAQQVTNLPATQRTKEIPVSEESACSARAPGSIPGSERSPREGNGNPLQYSRLENPMDRGARWATDHGVT